MEDWDIKFFRKNVKNVKIRFQNLKKENKNLLQLGFLLYL